MDKATKKLLLASARRIANELQADINNDKDIQRTVDGLRADNNRLRADNDRLQADNKKLTEENHKLAYILTKITTTIREADVGPLTYDSHDSKSSQEPPTKSVEGSDRKGTTAKVPRASSQDGHPPGITMAGNIKPREHDCPRNPRKSHWSKKIRDLPELDCACDDNGDYSDAPSLGDLMD